MFDKFLSIFSAHQARWRGEHSQGWPRTGCEGSIAHIIEAGAKWSCKCLRSGVIYLGASVGSSGRDSKRVLFLYSTLANSCNFGQSRVVWS